MSLFDFRVGLAGGEPHMFESRQASCNLQAGDLYLYPNATSTVDATQPVTFKWNTACTGISSTVDLYLYSSGSTGLIQAFRGLSFSQGQYTATLLPKWWNSTTTAQLQFNIVNSGGMSWATTGPAGPVWTVTYPESAMFQTTTDQGGAVKTSTAAVAAATNSGDAIIQNVTNTKEGGISKGAVAAAVIVPLLVIAALAAIAVRFWRQREAEKRRRWSQALSHHSALEWEKGARAGEKTQSILGRPSLSMYMRGDAGGDGGDRASMATSSVYAVENNMAGAGAAGLLTRPNLSGLRSVSADNVNGSNASVRSSVIMPDGNVRQSRISFAESARPDRRSRMSFGGDIRPPNTAVFKLPGGSRSASELVTPRGKVSSSAFLDEDEDDLNISPTQRDGPGKPRVISGIRTGARKSVMSFVGGDKRRESSASALSQHDFRSAVDAGGSVDELRDLEAMMLARRSVMSQYSANRSSSFVEPNSPNAGHSQHIPSHYSNPSSPALGYADNDRMEDLSQSDSTQSMNAGSYFKPLPSAASTSTVAYGPDQMLAVYAARAANAKSPPGSAGSGMAMAPPAAPFGGASTPVGNGSISKKGGMKILTSFGRKDSDSGPSSGYSDVQRDTLSPVGGAPSPSLRVPPVVMTRQRSGTVGRGGQPSPNGGDDVGHAQ